jgi:AcrR family transcriptional regulator
VPRAGLDTAGVVRGAAEVADEVGFANLSMGLVAERLGVRTPSLYKHVDGLADLGRKIAVLALTELGDAVRDAIQGRSGPAALDGLARAMRDYVIEHPGRYAATIGIPEGGPGDPLTVAGQRIIASMVAVLEGYRIGPDDMSHALRTLRSLLHGFATLQAANGFQWNADAEESFTWLVAFANRALSAAPPLEPGVGAAPPLEPRISAAPPGRRT